MRLTKEIREHVIDEAVRRSEIPARQAAYKARLMEWIEAVRVASIGGAEALAGIEKDLEVVNAIKKKYPNLTNGKELFNVDTYLLVNVGGLRTHVYFYGGFRYSSEAYKHNKITAEEFTIKRGDPLEKEFQALEVEKERVAQAEENLKGDVTSIVYSVNSDKRLLEIWPEAKYLMPKAMRSIVNLPAIPIKDINAQLGLPPDETGE